jgi:hypothetical protein
VRGCCMSGARHSNGQHFGSVGGDIHEIRMLQHHFDAVPALFPGENLDAVRLRPYSSKTSKKI